MPHCNTAPRTAKLEVRLRVAVMRGVRVPEIVFTMSAASAMTTLGAIPVFLLSAQSVLVRRDLDFDEAHFGLAVSCFFAAAATAALLGGGIVDRLGRRRSTVLAGTISVLGGAGLALGAHSFAVLLVMLIVLGVANASLQVTSNLSLAKSVPRHRQGLAFGVKQSAIPLAIVLGGLAVPSMGAILGWRWTFGTVAMVAVLVIIGGLFLPREEVTRGAAQVSVEMAPVGALALTAVAMAVASAAVNSLGAFLASWGFQIGMTPSQTGFLMAAGSGLSIGARVLTGHRADQRVGRNLPVVAMQMLFGSVALAVVSIGNIPTLWVSAILAFGIGWAWPGLMLFAVVRMGREAPGAASAAVQAGAFVGGASGPALFGLLVSHTDYPFAWRVASLFMLIASGLVLLARRMFLRDMGVRPLSRKGSPHGSS
jgi:predicted MFS family arabinose efflux permease